MKKEEFKSYDVKIVKPKEEFKTLSEKVIILRKGVNTIKVKDYCPIIHLEDVKEFIKRDTEIIDDFIRGKIDEAELIARRIKLAGEALVE